MSKDPTPRTERFFGPRRDECVHALFAADYARRLVREVLAGKTPEPENFIALIGELEKLDDVVFRRTGLFAEEGSFSERAISLKDYWPKDKGQSIEIEGYNPPDVAPLPESLPMRSML